MPRLALAVLFVILVGWLTFAVSVGAVLRDRAPDRALSLTPWDARALATRAEQRLAADGLSAPAITASRQDSLAALRRDPTTVVAWRTLALTEAASGDQVVASRLFRVSEQLSRRDLPTQLWLIEEQVGKGDVVGALVHYDIALRTSTGSYDTLIPILVAAVDDPRVVAPLGKMLASAPAWSNYFYYKLTQAPPDPEQSARLLEYARRGGPLNNPEMVGVLLANMVGRGAYGPALRVYGVLSGARHGLPKGVFDGGFDRDGGYPPFDWELTNTPELGAEPRDQAASGGRALTAFVDSDHDGAAARQLLVLAPGDYRLAYRAGTTDAPAATLAWRLVCAGQAATPVTNQPIDVRRPGAMQRAALTVPGDCPAQWLYLDAAASHPDQNEAWVDAVTIASTRDGRPIR